MDSKPQRPLESLWVGGGDENAYKPDLHKYKSTAALGAIPVVVGGLRADAKRTAFNDLSISKNVSIARDDPAIRFKGFEVGGYEVKTIQHKASAREPLSSITQACQGQHPLRLVQHPMQVQAATKRNIIYYQDPVEKDSSVDVSKADVSKANKEAEELYTRSKAEVHRRNEVARNAEQKLHVHENYLHTIAHSIRSRGDNTTGCIVANLMPQWTDDVLSELDDAALMVKRITTVEELEEESWDTGMVAEYSDEIFQYMRDLEVEEEYCIDPDYMQRQREIKWSMRSVLMDWIIQVHQRFALLPETLFLCVNCIDRFLACKNVSMDKLQLAGITALYIASKYEEIKAPSLKEVLFMVNGYTSKEILLKAELHMLRLLDFQLGAPGPSSFLRRIGQADDYDLETRTLSKYLIEFTIMDERFIGSPPSFIAAGAHALARIILKKGDWTLEHVHYAGYVWKQLLPLVVLLLSCCEDAQKHHASIFEKYADKRFGKASLTVMDALSNGIEIEGVGRRFITYHSYILPNGGIVQGPYYRPT